MKINTRDLILIALFAAITAVCAQIRVPMWPVPATLQTLAVTFSGLLLGSKRGALAMGVYGAVGLAGMPVFAGGGGIGYAAMPSFGFILAFVPAAFVIGLIAERDASLPHYFAASLAGFAATYAVGLTYAFFVGNLFLGKDYSAVFVLEKFFLLFVPFDLIKIAVAAPVCLAVSRRLKYVLRGVS